MKNRIWVVVLSMLALASCQSSRFMQDDMYFTDIDAKRELREYEINKKNSANTANASDDMGEQNVVLDKVSSDNYYDYSYSSRIRRFNTPNNTWSYYDPYYTNYYWYNNSTAKYFGNSVYSTYTWWGPNFGNNYSYDNWGVDYFRSRSNSITWKGTWSNNKSLYFNSFDNNCYVNAPKKKIMFAPRGNNFSLLMLSNGITRDVVQRPDINYTAIRQANPPSNFEGSETNIVLAPVEPDSGVSTLVVAADTSATVTIPRMNASKVVVNNNPTKNTNSNQSVGATTNTTNTNTTNTNTTKRWDNYNADVNISPNNNTNSNWSRSGVFSEGSRNNNYEYKGSTMPNKNGTNSNKTEKKPK